jgi:protein involved in polysaccharide export with SLBB domain
VVGNVWTPGLIGFSPGMRLSDALRAAGGVKPDTYLADVQVSRVRPDSGRMMFRTALVDTTGAVVDDMQLKDGDEIRTFALHDFRQERFVTISGAVRKPGKVQFRDGMTLRDLVLQAGGVKESALLTYAEVARMPETRAAGATARTLRAELDSTYLFERAGGGRYLGPPGVPAPAARAPEFLLDPYDNVLILVQPDWALHRTVTILGEVKYPGVYTLLSRTERLADVVGRAGGLTRNAYANGIEFYRDSVSRIGIDLPSVLKDAGHVDNLLLVDRDSIVIPVFSGIVNVKGEVNAPVGVAYVSGADIDYYIRAAGGGSVKADVGRAYVVQPNGKLESRNRRFGLWKSTPRPEPGSKVAVPPKDPTNRTDYVALTAALTSLLGSAVALAAILKR